MPKFRNVRIRKPGGGFRMQRAMVLRSGKLKFVKNIKRKRVTKNVSRRRTKKRTITRRRRTTKRPTRRRRKVSRLF